MRLVELTIVATFDYALSYSVLYKSLPLRSERTPTNIAQCQCLISEWTIPTGGLISDLINELLLTSWMLVWLKIVIGSAVGWPSQVNHLNKTNILMIILGVTVIQSLFSLQVWVNRSLAISSERKNYSSRIEAYLTLCTVQNIT